MPAPADKAESRQIADLREAIRTLLTPAEREIIMTDLAGGEGDADDQRLAENNRPQQEHHPCPAEQGAQKDSGTDDQKGHYQGTQRGTP